MGGSELVGGLVNLPQEVYNLGSGGVWGVNEISFRVINVASFEEFLCITSDSCCKVKGKVRGELSVCVWVRQGLKTFCHVLSSVHDGDFGPFVRKIRFESFEGCFVEVASDGVGYVTVGWSVVSR